MKRRRATALYRQATLVFCVATLATSVSGFQMARGVLHPEVDGLNPGQTFDAIVVLSGEDRRLERGLELAEAGLAPVLVAMYGGQWQGTRSQCRTKNVYETLCPVPPEDSTRGEARLIGEMAVENDWTSILVVTGDYHLSRAQMLIERCVEDSTYVAFEPVDWTGPGQQVLRAEVGKTVFAKFIARSC